MLGSMLNPVYRHCPLVAKRQIYNQLRHYASQPAHRPRHLLSLADLSVPEIEQLLVSAYNFKRDIKLGSKGHSQQPKPLTGKTIALIFSKRSTRTRVASESSLAILGGHPMFLSPQDIQLGVNETLYDTSRVVSSMVDGIFARVGDHSEIETLSQNSTVPVVNALSSLYHPTQILADLLTLLETYAPGSQQPKLDSLAGLTVAWVGDSNNILNDMIVSFGRIGINLNIATPKGYELDQTVLKSMESGFEKEKPKGKLLATNSPEEAVRNADVLVTDTWISMGQETEKAQRLRDFAGFQITSKLASGAKSDWKFMHCLPRKQEEVTDEVFYDEKRSLVWSEAENRKWTSLSTFDAFFAKSS